VAKHSAKYPFLDNLYCPRANPIERAFGDTHDKVTRNHKRKRLRDLVADVGQHLDHNAP